MHKVGRARPIECALLGHRCSRSTELALALFQHAERSSIAGLAFGQIVGSRDLAEEPGLLQILSF